MSFFSPIRRRTKKNANSIPKATGFRRRFFRLAVEELEQRLAPASLFWDGGAGTFNFNDAQNWVGDIAPGTGDHAIISSDFSTQEIRIIQDVDLDRLTSAAKLAIAASTTLVSATMNLSNDLVMQGGTLRNATVNFTDGAQIRAQSGSLDHVEVNGDVDLSTNGGSLRTVNGLTLNGKATLGSANNTYGTISFAGTQTLDGNATIALAGYGYFYGGFFFSGHVDTGISLDANTTLTIGAGVVIEAESGYIGSGTDNAAIINYGRFEVNGLFGATRSINAATFVNHGQLIVSGAGQRLNVNSATFENNGQLTSQGGGSLTVTGLTGNLGTASVLGTGSTLSIQGNSFVVDQGLTAAAGTTLSLLGTWSNPTGQGIVASGATLNLGDQSAPFGAWTNAGTISVTDSTVNLGGTFTLATLGDFRRNGGTLNLTGILDNSGLTLALDGTTGTWRLQGGTILGGRLTTAHLDFVYGTLDDVTLDNDLTLGGSYVIIKNRLTLNQTTITLASNNASLYLDGDILGTGNTVLSAGNSIYLTSIGNHPIITIGEGVTISGYGSIYSYAATLKNYGTIQGGLYSAALTVTSTVENYGTLKAFGGGTLSISGITGNVGHATIDAGSSLSLDGTDYVINQGLVANGGVLSLLGSWTNPLGASILATGATLNLGDQSASSTRRWTNAGEIIVNNSTVNLGGRFSLAALGDFNRTGGIVNITGTFDNMGTTLALDANTGSWRLHGGAILGGNITATGGAAFQVGSGGTLDGVTLDSDVTIASIETYYQPIGVTVKNGLGINGILTVGAQATLALADTQTISGTGELHLGGTTSTGTVTAGGTLTIDSAITIRATGYASLYNTQPSDEIVLRGDIFVTNGNFTLGSGAGRWRNEGVITTQNCTFNLGGSFLLENLGTFHHTNTQVNIAGTLDNRSRTLAFDSTTGSWGLNYSGTILGGNVTAIDGTYLKLFGGTLDGVALDGPTKGKDGSAIIRNGLTLNSTLELENFSLYFYGPQTLAGAGTINILGTGVSNLYAQTLVIGTDITINVTGTGGILNTSHESSFVNHGKIFVSNGTFTLGGGSYQEHSWKNHGVVSAQDSTINLGGRFVFETLGNFRRLGGTINVVGIMDNTGQTLTLDDTTGSWRLDGYGLIMGGSIVTTSGATLGVGNGYLSDVTLAGVNITIDGSLVSYGDLAGTADLSLRNPSSSLYVAQLGSATSATIHAGITIHGQGTIASGPLVNRGTISADANGGILTLRPSAFINEGSLLTQLGSTLVIEGRFSQSAAARIQGGGTFIIRSAGTIDNPQVFENRAANMGLSADGFRTPAFLGTLELQNSQVLLGDDFDDVTGTGAEALYLSNLVVDLHSQLNLNALPIYVRTSQINGSVTGGSVNQLVDLVITAVTLPENAISGLPAAFTWTVQNQSNQPVTGSWQDALYLSHDPFLDAADRLLAVVPHSTALAAGESYTGELALDLPALLPGPYYVIVNADRRGQVDNGRFVTNNSLASTTTMSVTISELHIGVPIQASFEHASQTRYFQVTIPTGGPTLALNLDGSSLNGANEIAVRRGNLPTSGVADWRTTTYWPDQELLAPDLGPGVYYVAVTHLFGPAAESFTLTATLPRLAVSRLDVTQGSNTGRVTVGIHGSRFTADTQASLIGPGGTALAAVAVKHVDASTLYATFDLTGTAIGDYTLRLSDGTTTADAPTPFQVNADQPGRVEVFLSAPGAVRPNTRGQITIRYVNTGSTDVVAPLLLVSSLGGVIRHFDQETFSPDVQILAINRAGPAGILSPGAEGTIHLTFVPAGGVGGVITFEVRQASDPTAPIDWDALRDTSRPDSVLPDAWNAIWSNLTAQVGANVGQFNAVLADNATRLSELGEYTADVSRLLAFELQQAGDSVPFRTLAGGTDAAYPAPGLSLAFTRQFLQPLDSRYRLGILGRGWSYTGDAQLSVNDLGDVSILAGGAVRFFKKNGTDYTPSPGDHGILSLTNGIYSVRELDGSVTSFRAGGRFDFVTDTHGNRITAEYTGGLMTALVHSNGSRLTLAYNGQGRLISVTDPAGRATTFTYDANNEYLLSATDAFGTTRYTYETAGTIQQRHALTSIANPDGTHVFFTYDTAGRLIHRNLDGGAEAVTIAYDSAGGVTVSDSVGGKTTMLYNDAGQVGLSRDVFGREQRFQYDAKHNLVSVAAPLGTHNSFVYDERGNVTKQTDALGNSVLFAYETQFNHLTTLTDSRGNVTRYQYEADGDLRAIAYPGGTKEQFAYDPLGNLTMSVNRRGQPIRYETDERGLVTKKLYPDGTQIDYAYDVRGNMIRATDASGDTLMEYDPVTDEMTKITYPTGMFLQYTYENGRRVKMVDHEGFTVNYLYDSLGRLSELRDVNGGLIVHYTYDIAGRLERKDNGNHTYTTYVYDAAGQILSLVNHAPDGSANSRFDYTYDALGRRTSMTTLDGVTTYGYDAKGQLTSVAIPGGRIITYEYDSEGNRLAVTDDGVRTVYTTNELNQYLKVGENVLQYDLDGNLTSITNDSGVVDYKYDIANRLVRIHDSTGTTSLEYDLLGGRSALANADGQMTYLIDPLTAKSIVRQFDLQRQVTTRFVFGSGLETQFNSEGQSFYYDFDLCGSVIGLSGADGNYENRYQYLPFGEKLSVEVGGHIANPFTFQGRFGVTSETENADMRLRHYAPALGRFLSRDPIHIAGGINLYAYTTNSPVNLIDPTGDRGYVDINYTSLGGVLLGHLVGLVVGVGPTGGFIVSRDGIYVYGGIAGGAAPGLGEGGGVTPPTPSVTFSPNEPTEGWNYSVQANVGAASSLGVDQNLVPYREYGGSPGVPSAYVSAFYLAKLVPFSKPVGDSVDRAVLEPTSKLIEKLEAFVRTIIVRALDPNDLIGPAGVGVGNWLRPEQVLPYTINFENDPKKATAPALDVVVTQQLDADLDWTTFALGAFHFGSMVVMPPDKLKAWQTSVDYHNPDGSPLRVDIDARLDLQTGIVTWIFRSIDPATGGVPFDPFAGFLPPDDETGRGKGSVSYTIRVKPDQPSGTRLDGIASIVFDTNDAILTPAIFNTIDAGTPTSRVLPMADPKYNSFIVSWGGSDETGGSGVASWDIFVSINGRAFEPWLTGVAASQTSALFVGAYNQSYAFYSVAIDAVGHRENAVPIAQAFVVTPAFAPLDDGRTILNLASFATLFFAQVNSSSALPGQQAQTTLLANFGSSGEPATSLDATNFSNVTFISLLTSLVGTGGAPGSFELSPDQQRRLEALWQVLSDWLRWLMPMPQNSFVNTEELAVEPVSRAEPAGGPALVETLAATTPTPPDIDRIWATLQEEEFLPLTPSGPTPPSLTPSLLGALTILGGTCLHTIATEFGTEGARDEEDRRRKYLSR